MSRPNAGLLAWALFGLAVAALLVYGFVASRGPSLRLELPAEVLEGTPGSIRTYGSVSETIEGDAGKVSLASVPAGPGVIAVGSLSGLRGEVAILRGERWLSRVDPGGRVVAERAPGTSDTAGFLALADVPRFQEQRLDAPVPFERLETELEQRGRRAGLDTSRPFPVLLEGTLSSVAFHVVNGAAFGAGERTEERLRETASNVAVPRAEGSVLGFYAARGGERLVREGQRLHLHVVLPTERRMGHLDSAQVEAGSRLLLPATP